MKCTNLFVSVCVCSHCKNSALLYLFVHRKYTQGLVLYLISSKLRCSSRQEFQREILDELHSPHCLNSPVLDIFNSCYFFFLLFTLLIWINNRPLLPASKLYTSKPNISTIISLLRLTQSPYSIRRLTKILSSSTLLSLLNSNLGSEYVWWNYSNSYTDHGV